MARAGLNSVPRQISKMLRKNFRLVIIVVIICVLIGLFVLSKKYSEQFDSQTQLKGFNCNQPHKGKRVKNYIFEGSERCSATEDLRNIEGDYLPKWQDRCNALTGKTFSEAQKICDINNARLCSYEEIRQQKTRGTGCKFDKTDIWTSESRITNGRGGNNRKEEKYEHRDAVEDRYNVRCCRNPRDPPPPYTCRTIRKKRTKKEASDICKALKDDKGIKRYHLCSRNALEKNLKYIDITTPQYKLVDDKTDPEEKVWEKTGCNLSYWVKSKNKAYRDKFYMGDEINDYFFNGDGKYSVTRDGFEGTALCCEGGMGAEDEKIVKPGKSDNYFISAKPPSTTRLPTTTR